jgi:glycosyltransferase involved in cell wall biosynthesis
VNGFVSENFDSIELAKLIKVLLSHSDLRAKMGEEARQRSQTLFSLKRQLNDHIKAYEQAKRIRIEARNA